MLCLKIEMMTTENARLRNATGKKKFSFARHLDVSTAENLGNRDFEAMPEYCLEGPNHVRVAEPHF